MGLARALAVALSGLEGHVVEVECDISAGLPGLAYTGSADASVVESRDRLRAAVHNSGAGWPKLKITVALLPADVPKAGSRFDLAICMALLAADEQVPRAAVERVAWISELGLDGRLRPVRGVLPSVLAASSRGITRVVVAQANAAEAALVSGVEVRAAERLADVVAWLTGQGPPLAVAAPTARPPVGPDAPDLLDVAGQTAAKRAVEIAAAGGHHLYLVGAAGAGKTMLAERLPGVLPVLDEAASLEVTAVHSIAGLLGEQADLVRRPPFQAPHHTASVAALVGGGSYLARPGAISLAHHGVLFLDEASEFSARALDALRQPLENGHVVLHRGGGAVRYPARFQLVLAANPCPCAKPPRDCSCSPATRHRYAQRLSGPLMDRIDLQVQINPVPRRELFNRLADGESSAVVAARVAAAREAATSRWHELRRRTNAEVPGSLLREKPWALPGPVLAPVEHFLERGMVSARGFDRILRISWTMADLAGRALPDADDVAEALFYRTGQAGTWAA
jgi:magnesium chelatase family protein